MDTGLRQRRSRILKIEITGQSCPDVNRRILKRLARRVLRGERFKKSGKVSVVLVDNASIRSLNKRYLGKDRETDVLSFTYGEDDVYGETYISVEQAREQAEEFGVSLETEMARLVIHGLLHILGYEDDTPDRKKKMTLLEDQYLS